MTFVIVTKSETETMARKIRLSWEALRQRNSADRAAIYGKDCFIARFACFAPSFQKRGRRTPHIAVRLRRSRNFPLRARARALHKTGALALTSTETGPLQLPRPRHRQAAR